MTSALYLYKDSNWISASNPYAFDNTQFKGVDGLLGLP